MSGSMINVYINYTKNYVYFGTEPLDSKIILYSYMLEPNKDVIKLKVIIFKILLRLNLSTKITMLFH